MTAYWIDGDVLQCGADKPLHAGILKDLCLGDLDRALNQSGYRLQSIPHGSAGLATHLMVTEGEWEDCSPEWGGWPVPIRTSEGDYRNIKITLQGYVLTAGAKATVRVYAMPVYYREIGVHTSWGLLGSADYVEMTIESTSLVAVSGTITITNSGPQVGYAPDETTFPENPYDEIALYALVKFASTGAGEYLKLAPPLVEEVPQ